MTRFPNEFRANIKFKKHFVTHLENESDSFRKWVKDTSFKNLWRYTLHSVQKAEKQHIIVLNSCGLAKVLI